MKGIDESRWMIPVEGPVAIGIGVPTEKTCKLMIIDLVYFSELSFFLNYVCDL